MHSGSTPRGGGVRLRALTLATSVALVAFLIPATAGVVLGHQPSASLTCVSGVPTLSVSLTYYEPSPYVNTVTITTDGAPDSNSNSNFGTTYSFTEALSPAFVTHTATVVVVAGDDPSNPLWNKTYTLFVPACVPPPPSGGEILPTNTECSDFVNNTTPALAGIFYKVSGGNITKSINPGVFFYYTYVTTTTAGATVTTSQHATNSAPLFSLNQGHIWVYTASCALVSQPTQAGTSVSFTIATPGTYVLRLQYSTKSIAGLTAPTASPSTYSFDINGTDNASVPLIKQ
jgi:hypothetical protein